MENEEYSKQKIRECADGRAALALSPYISHNCWISSGDEGNQRRHRALMFHCPLGKSSAGAYHATSPRLHIADICITSDTCYKRMYMLAYIHSTVASLDAIKGQVPHPGGGPCAADADIFK